jgi:hypothetical protein
MVAEIRLSGKAGCTVKGVIHGRLEKLNTLRRKRPDFDTQYIRTHGCIAKN